jgi:hypothetical protein
VTVVSLSARGRRVEQRMAEVRANHMADVLDHWSPADLDRLGGLLERLVTDLRAARYRPVDDRPVDDRPVDDRPVDDRPVEEKQSA